MPVLARQRQSLARRLLIDHRLLIASVVDIDLHRISLPMAIRNTIGIAWPIIVAVALGHPELAIITGIGAFSIAFSDRPGADLYKFPRMFGTALLAASSVFLGLILHGQPVMITIVAMLLSGFAALLTVFGPGPTQSGATSLVAFFVATQFERSPIGALQWAGIVVLVGLVQSLLAITVEPVRVRDTRGETMLSAFRVLAQYVRNPGDHQGEVPAAAQITASTQLVATYDASPGARESRHIINSIQRLQSNVIIIGLLANDRGTVIDRRTRVAMQQLAGAAIEANGARILADTGDASALPEMIALEALLGHVRANVDSDPTATDIDRLIILRFEAILEELSTRLWWIDDYRRATSVIAGPGAWLQAWVGRVRGNLAVLRGQLAWDSATVRHAIRQMLVVGISFAIAFLFDVPWGFWIPLTAVVVLRPDYGQTLSRGVGRLLGTFVGLAIGSLLVTLWPEGLWWWVAVVVACAFLVRLLAPTGYVLTVMAISTYVVALLHIRGLSPLDAFVDRSINTAVGGMIAVGVFLAWPTWEHVQSRQVLADMLAAYQRVFTVGIGSILEPGTYGDPEIHMTRSSARLARANANGFISRIRIEPGLSRTGLEAGQDLLVHVQRMALHQLALEGYLRGVDIDALPTSFTRFTQAVGDRLNAAQDMVQDGETTDASPLVSASELALEDLQPLTGDPQMIGVARGVRFLTADVEKILIDAQAATAL